MKIALALVAGLLFAAGGVVFGLSSSGGHPMPAAVPGAPCGVEGQKGALSDKIYTCAGGVWQARLDGANPAR